MFLITDFHRQVASPFGAVSPNTKAAFKGLDLGS